MGNSKLGDGLIYTEGVGPYVQLKDTTATTGLNLKIINVGGKIYVYNIDAELIVAPIYPRTEIYTALHTPTIATSGAAETASTTWKETIFACPAGISFEVMGVGFMPNAAFGQATNYAILTCMNKGIAGADSTQIASKAFSSAATVNAINSLGTLSNITVIENQTITIEKTVAGSGQIVPTGTHYLFLKRTE